MTPCGCGGSGAAAQNREIIRRDLPKPTPPVSYGDPGFTWNGPKREATPAPMRQPEPEPAK